MNFGIHTARQKTAVVKGGVASRGQLAYAPERSAEKERRTGV